MSEGVPGEHRVARACGEVTSAVEVGFGEHAAEGGLVAAGGDAEARGLEERGVRGLIRGAEKR